MIEVEKKFLLKKRGEERLIENAEFVKELVLTDTYYDTKDYSLSKRNTWLRARNGHFELKIPLQDISRSNEEASFVDQYDEIRTEEEIRKALGISSNKILSKDLEISGYHPFTTFTTTRKRYKKEGFTIDLDIVNYGYNVTEIELMVKNNSEVEEATKKIIAFAKKQKLTIAPVKGKVLEWMKRNNPANYQIITDTWKKNPSKRFSSFAQGFRRTK